MTKSQKDSTLDEYETYCGSIVPIVRKSIYAIEYESLEEGFHKKTVDFLSKQFIKSSSHLSNHQDLLNNSFIVGEKHADISPKKFLIENMKALKKAGFETLYMEHLYYDQQQDLDVFSKTGIASTALKSRLLELDQGHGFVNDFGQDSEIRQRLWGRNNFTALVTAAQEAGIRIVGIDVKHVYEAHSAGNERTAGMNYTAFHIINRENTKNESKWFALMGETHVKEFNNVPGVADMFGVSGVFIYDTDRENRNEDLGLFRIVLSQPYITVTDVILHPDLLVIQDPAVGTLSFEPSSSLKKASDELTPQIRIVLGLHEKTIPFRYRSILKNALLGIDEDKLSTIQRAIKEVEELISQKKASEMKEEKSHPELSLDFFASKDEEIKEKLLSLNEKLGNYGFKIQKNSASKIFPITDYRLILPEKSLDATILTSIIDACKQANMIEANKSSHPNGEPSFFNIPAKNLTKDNMDILMQQLKAIPKFDTDVSMELK